jgi:hypothetical protein
MRARAATVATSVRGVGVEDAVGRDGAGCGWCDPPQPANPSAAITAQTRRLRTGQVNQVSIGPIRYSSCQRRPTLEKSRFSTGLSR